MAIVRIDSVVVAIVVIATGAIVPHATGRLSCRVTPNGTTTCASGKGGVDGSADGEGGDHHRRVRWYRAGGCPAVRRRGRPGAARGPGRGDPEGCHGSDRSARGQPRRGQLRR